MLISQVIFAQHTTVMVLNLNMNIGDGNVSLLINQISNITIHIKH